MVRRVRRASSRHASVRSHAKQPLHPGSMTSHPNASRTTPAPSSAILSAICGVSTRVFMP